MTIGAPKRVAQYESVQRILMDFKVPVNQPVPYVGDVQDRDTKFVNQLLHGSWKPVSPVTLRVNEEDIVVTKLSSVDGRVQPTGYLVDTPRYNFILFTLKQVPSDAKQLTTLIGSFIREKSPPGPVLLRTAVDPDPKASFPLLGDVPIFNSPASALAKGFDFDVIAARTNSGIDVMFIFGKNLVPGLYEPWMLISDRFPPITEQLKTKSEEQILSLLKTDHPDKEEFVLKEAIQRKIDGTKILSAAGITPGAGKQAQQSLADFLEIASESSHAGLYAGTIKDLYSVLAKPGGNDEMLAVLVGSSRRLQSPDLTDDVLKLLLAGRIQRESLFYLQERVSKEEQLARLKEAPVNPKLKELKRIAVQFAQSRIWRNK